MFYILQSKTFISPVYWFNYLKDRSLLQNLHEIGFDEFYIHIEHKYSFVSYGHILGSLY
jgi:hypothetical protein